MKKYFLTFILVIILILEITYNKKIVNTITTSIVKTPALYIMPNNSYTKDYDFQFVKNTTDYTPYSYYDLLNIFYTVINNGWDEFTFYCPNAYENCIRDIKRISNDEELLSIINNFANPFNSFTSISTAYDETGEITIKITKLYDQNKETIINNKIDNILATIITPDMTIEDKIKTIHDYIINTTKYDIEKNNTGHSNYESNTAYGALIEGAAICNGYADAMALFLDRLNIKNYKIASTTHIWNAVYINDTWLHLDLTWDDPVSDDGKDYLYHKYFLINNEELKQEDKDLPDHIFNSSVYLEFK